MANIEELRSKIARLGALLNNVMDQQAHKAIRDLMAEAEEQISQADAGIEGNADRKASSPPEG
jgi:hypothetical protein